MAVAVETCDEDLAGNRMPIAETVYIVLSSSKAQLCMARIRMIRV